MKKLFTSTLLTVAAVPFLMAAPNAAKKAQNQAPASTDTQTTSTTPKVKAKKHVKKAKTTATATAAPSTPAQK